MMNHYSNKCCNLDYWDNTKSIQLTKTKYQNSNQKRKNYKIKNYKKTNCINQKQLDFRKQQDMPIKEDDQIAKKNRNLADNMNSNKSNNKKL